MIDSQIQSEILQALEHLPLAQQQHVVEFAKELKSDARHSAPAITRPGLGSIRDDENPQNILEYYQSRLQAMNQNSAPLRFTPFENIMHLIGSLPADAADEMERAIEEHCEQIEDD